MSAAEARAILASLELSQTEFAELIDVGPRTVRRWLSETAQDATPIPGTIVLLLWALRDCPLVLDYLRAKRLERLHALRARRHRTE